MSQKHTDYAWTAKVSGTTLLALLAMARAADDNGEVYMSCARLSKMTGMSTRTAYRCMLDLKHIGEIVLVQQGGGGTSTPNLWKIDETNSD